MAAEVKFVVYGISDEGYGWRCYHDHVTFEEANEEAEHWAQNSPEAWVEKHTTYREIVKSISGPGLPETALIPA